MIDTHCHLIAGVDDGPTSEAGSVELARRLVAGGVELVVCTPHYSRRFPTVHADAVERSRALRATLTAEGVPLDIAVAAEVSPTMAVTADPSELVTRSIGGRFSLVELVPATPAGFLPSLGARLEKAGLLPILAHPERCRAVQRRPAILDAARAEGALVQVVAPSLTGVWGEEVSATAWKLLNTGRADLLASDAHGRRSPPALAAATDLVAERLGDKVAHRLTDGRPRLVVRGVHPAEVTQGSGGALS